MWHGERWASKAIMFDLPNLVKQIPEFGVAASLVVAVVGLVASVVTSWLTFRRKTPDMADLHAKLEDMTRIDEVRKALELNESVAGWAGRSNGPLIFGQVIIGGVLATSFVQSQLNQAAIGPLRVLVLVSSLIHQQLRPDLKNRNARRRAVKLTHLLKEAEDGVFEIQQSSPTAPTIESLRRRVTRQLSQIEQTSVEEMPGERQVGLKPLVSDQSHAATGRILWPNPSF